MKPPSAKRAAEIADRALANVSELPDYDQKHCALWYDGHDLTRPVCVISFSDLKLLAAYVTKGKK